MEDNLEVIVVAILSLAALFAGAWMLDLVAWTLVLVGAAGLALVARHVSTRQARRMALDPAAMAETNTLDWGSDAAACIHLPTKEGAADA